MKRHDGCECISKQKLEQETTTGTHAGYTSAQLRPTPPDARGTNRNPPTRRLAHTRPARSAVGAGTCVSHQLQQTQLFLWCDLAILRSTSILQSSHADVVVRGAAVSGANGQEEGDMHPPAEALMQLQALLAVCLHPRHTNQALFLSAVTASHG